MDYHSIETEEERVANIHCGCWVFILFFIILAIDLFLGLYINYSGAIFTCHKMFYIGVYIWWVHLSLIVISIYSYRSMTYKSPVWSCALKCLLSCTGLWFLVIVLKIMVPSTIEETSQCFGLTVDEMILFLIKEFFILFVLTTLLLKVRGYQHEWIMKRSIEDIKIKADKRIDEIMNTMTKPNIIQYVEV